MILINIISSIKPYIISSSIITKCIRLKIAFQCISSVSTSFRTKYRHYISFTTGDGYTNFAHLSRIGTQEEISITIASFSTFCTRSFTIDLDSWFFSRFFSDDINYTTNSIRTIFRTGRSLNNFNTFYIFRTKAHYFIRCATKFSQVA